MIAVNQDPLGIQGLPLEGFPLCGDGSPNCTHTGVIGKRLSVEGAVALLAVNLGPTTNITCNSACLGQLGIQLSETFRVRDVWTNETSTVRASVGWTAVLLPSTTARMVVLEPIGR